MEQFEGLYISSGEGNQMFTLRSSEKQYGRNQNCWFRDTHIRNLSTDLEQAKQKAREYAGYDVPVMVSDNLEDINRRDKKRKGADIVRTGFLAGKSIYDLSDWELSQNIYNIQKAPKKFQELYFEEMELRQLYYGGQRRVLTQGKEVLKKLKNLKRREEYQKELEEKQAKQNFVGQIGERMTFDLVLEFETSGASQWGNWYLYNLLDEVYEVDSVSVPVLTTR